MSRSKNESWHMASLGQQVSYHNPILRLLVGSDREISDSIAVLLVLRKNKMINPNDKNIDFILDLLDNQRKSAFVTSDKTDILTKLSIMLPKEDRVINDYGD